ncbi:uncharacterized protein B0I36DRAFT_361443 [Microdochium trichocladiopsis]|uniref:DUF7605 domain-containing protein n=1 Tax=Microdochium trichocladiopsis TaxID=1682393 RepID=A0A9P8YAR3_9PEZI|nr:uncharacterized protein B0I36DRAFT_361443 [Microdochium trichocladiopsis]KAH7032663.1 hypothetical protein B0I36DRAFT_361443 [Microdochium trichocladiopsis]
MVITEYHYRRPEQRSPITIEVEYLSRASRAELINDLVWNYRQFYLPVVESGETSPEEHRRFSRESDHAWSALETAFKHCDGFDESFLQGSLADSMSADEEAVQEETKRIAARLIEWADEIEWPAGAEGGLWSTTAQDAAECWTKTRLFTSNSVWPFTQRIRIYIDAQILKAGIVLADLPGLQDTNLARVRASQKYITHCDQILVVAQIGRAITDDSLHSSLKDIIKQHMATELESTARRPRVAVVCTRSDDIDVADAFRLFCGAGGRLENSTAMQAARQELSAAQSTGDFMALNAAKERQRVLLIQARNDHVTEGLQEACLSQIHTGHLPVFCVSNQFYQQHSEMGGKQAFIQLSQIPKLRQFCRATAADGQLAEVRNFLNSSLPQLLSSIDLWAIGYATKIAAVQPVLPDTRRLKQLLDRAPTNLYASQYHAWCVHNGEYETRNLKKNWNAEIIDRMRSELESAWSLVGQEFNNTLGELRDDLAGIIDELAMEAGGMSDRAYESFAAGVNGQQQKSAKI